MFPWALVATGKDPSPSCPEAVPAKCVSFCYVRTVVWGCRLSPGLTDLSLQVWAVNSAGKAPSSWSRCRTGPAPPEGLGAPRFHAVSSRHAVVNISAPARPNGMVSVYRLFCETGSGARTVVSSRAPGPRAGSPPNPRSFLLSRLSSTAPWRTRWHQGPRGERQRAPANQQGARAGGQRCPRRGPRPGRRERRGLAGSRTPWVRTLVPRTSRWPAGRGRQTATGGGVNVNTKKKKTHRAKDVPESSLWRTQASRRPLKRSLSFGDWEEVPVPRKGRQGSSAQPRQHRRVGLGARGTLGTRRPGHGTALSHLAVGREDARRPRHRSPRGCFRAQTPSQRGDVSFPAVARLCGRHSHSS